MQINAAQRREPSDSEHARQVSFFCKCELQQCVEEEQGLVGCDDKPPPPTSTRRAVKDQNPPPPSPLKPPPPPHCRTDLIIASCRVSVLQKCEWRSDVALTKGRSGAPPGPPDRLAAETHNEKRPTLTWMDMPAAQRNPDHSLAN